MALQLPTGLLHALETFPNPAVDAVALTTNIPRNSNFASGFVRTVHYNEQLLASLV